MFFVYDMEKRITLHPSYFNSNMKQVAINRLYEEVEGTNTGTMMILRIITIKDASEPKVEPGSGSALYTIAYQAVVWQPFRGEVVDGEVSQVVNNGFFVDVGALSVFVSKAMIPGTFKYTVEGSTPSFADNEGQVIEAQTQVRLRIKGIRSELGQMFAIGSIREDYLGPLLQ